MVSLTLDLQLSSKPCGAVERCINTSSNRRPFASFNQTMMHIAYNANENVAAAATDSVSVASEREGAFGRISVLSAV